MALTALLCRASQGTPRPQLNPGCSHCIHSACREGRTLSKHRNDAPGCGPVVKREIHKAASKERRRNM